jgi:hypothetical protein
MAAEVLFFTSSPKGNLTRFSTARQLLNKLCELFACWQRCMDHRYARGSMEGLNCPAFKKVLMNQDNSDN